MELPSRLRARGTVPGTTRKTGWSNKQGNAVDSHLGTVCPLSVRSWQLCPRLRPSSCSPAQPGSAVTLAPSPAPAPAPLCSARASSAPLPSSCRHRARARAPRSAGKLASVVTITNSIVLSRAPANKVIHYGASPGHRRLHGNQRAAGCPLAGRDTRQRRYLPGPARGAAAATLRPEAQPLRRRREQRPTAD